MKKTIIIVTAISSFLMFASCSKKTGKTDLNPDVVQTLNASISLNFTKDEYLIIGTKKSSEFILFENGPNGLILYWPIINDKIINNNVETEKLLSELKKLEFAQVNLSVVDEITVKGLKQKEFASSSDEIFVNVGKNSEQILILTTAIFQNVFNLKDLSNITAKVERIEDGND